MNSCWLGCWKWRTCSETQTRPQDTFERRRKFVRSQRLVSELITIEKYLAYLSNSNGTKAKVFTLHGKCEHWLGICTATYGEARKQGKYLLLAQWRSCPITHTRKYGSGPGRSLRWLSDPKRGTQHCSKFPKIWPDKKCVGKFNWGCLLIWDLKTIWHQENSIACYVNCRFCVSTTVLLFVIAHHFLGTHVTHSNRQSHWPNLQSVRQTSDSWTLWLLEL